MCQLLEACTTAWIRGAGGLHGRGHARTSAGVRLLRNFVLLIFVALVIASMAELMPMSPSHLVDQSIAERVYTAESTTCPLFQHRELWC